MKYGALAPLLVVAAVSCGDESAPPSVSNVQSGVGAPVDLVAIGARAVDSLRPDEVEALCEEENRRVDACQEQGRRSAAEPSACEDVVRACRDEQGDRGFRPSCEGAFSRSSGPCSITVDEYLACVDAWSTSLSCELAGHIVSPPACAALADRCERLVDGFSLYGKPLPCTPEEIAAEPADTNDDIVGLDACRPRPSRFIVLGDSIADCSGVSHDDCAADRIAAHLKAVVGPELVFETRAKAGSVVADLAGQAATIEGGDGHVYVWMYAIGNDLLHGISDPAPLVAGYQVVFDYFNDTSRFPDGATFLLNTQYDPYDQCTIPTAADPSSPAVTKLLLDMNQAVFLDVAEARSDTVAVDQLPDFLGHGQNADTTGCPYCRADNSTWVMAVHPTPAGHQHIADKWTKALDAMLECP
jgi:hypothetical protein